MERLTRRETGGVVLVGETVSDRQAAAGRALDRLAAYEETGYSPGQFETAMDAIKAHLWDVEQELKAYKDTGLEPEEIKELCTDDVAKIAKLFRHMIEDGSIDHLQELLDAEKAGRLVVLPCKVGDTVYYIEAPWGHWKYYELRMYTVSHLIIRKEGISVMAHEIIEPGMCLCHGEDFGRVAFIDKEDAKKRLDELNKDAEEALREEAEHG